MCNQEELMAYLDGEASAGMAEHLEECGDCQVLAAELRGVSARLMEWEVEPPGAGLDRRVRAALAPEKKVLARRWWPWALGTAGVCVVALVAVSIMPSQRVAQMIVPQRVSEGKLRVTMPMSAPMLARTAQIALSTTAFDKARAALDDILQRHQGYFGNVSLTAPDNAARSLVATLRVPTAQLDATLAEVRKLGHVQSESQSGEEVSAQYVDLEARLANARHTEQRLTDLLHQRTGDLADVLAVEKELDNTRGEIESMEAEEKALSKRVDYANLTVTITEDFTARPDASTLGRFRRAAIDGCQSLAGSIVAVALFLLAWAPTTLVWCGLLWLVYWGMRRLLARRRP
jgi:hypothetical protein